MNFRQLTYFMAVAEELHFGRAAERLGVAQPPLSRQIKQLEDELDTLLFHRGRSGVTLTQAGKRLFERGTEILSLMDDSKREIRRIGQGMQGRLRLGYVGSAVYGVLPTIVKSYRAANPKVFLSFSPMNNAGLQQALIRREIDIAIARPRLIDKEITSRPLGDEPLILAAPDTMFPGSTAIDCHDIADQVLVLYPEYPRPSFADVVLQALATQGLTDPKRIFTMDVSTSLGLVSVGEGVAIVPASVGSGTRNGIRFHPFASNIGTTGLSVSHRIDDQSVHVNGFVDVARMVARRSLS
ncbi:LysR family transcriptional regulator [Paracoccus aerodenitrificans]|uniref:LysR family transcriptional regulator n=1 Tax=Paracoccus aerodenitrificans TaxID=3017781 RepID=UPI0022F06BCA|nr:LysR substrate-binding domain-containing protein [Paracoccus aerodenitrificans]WBU63533.1 LysR substrate-binding domain-containing protein [Paracoccus aerodenitrificans]